MNMSRQMVLVARLDNASSTRSVDIGYTQSEWEKLTEDERVEIINDFTGEIVDLWVQPKE
ncbi:hypothetical protein AM403_02825 [Proteus mirabilis]|nr:hypothetical protein AM403_02825 [Proteus mirabilis]